MAFFVDTNILVYARDSSEGEKHRRALAWVDYLWQTRSGRLSFQVLQEFYVTVTRKLSPGLTEPEARADVRDLMGWHPIVLDATALEGAWVVQERFGLAFWDALILSAARMASCEHVLSEDLSDGQELDGIRVINPLSREPGIVD